MDWEPIETARKDGEPIVVCRPQSDFGVCDTVVTARWVEKYDDGEPLQKWCWPSRGADIFDEVEFHDAVERGDVYEADDFVLWTEHPIYGDSP